MTNSRLGISVAALGAILAVASTWNRSFAGDKNAGSTGHHLVVTNGQNMVDVYQDEATFEQVMTTKKGPFGSLAGDMRARMVAKKLPDRAPVRITAHDANGVGIEVTDGPYKGTKGFVAKENVE